MLFFLFVFFNNKYLILFIFTSLNTINCGILYFYYTVITKNNKISCNNFFRMTIKIKETTFNIFNLYIIYKYILR